MIADRWLRSCAPIKIEMSASTMEGREAMSLHRTVAILLLSAVASVTAGSIAAEAGCQIYQHRDYRGSVLNLRGGDTLQVAGEPCGSTGSEGRRRYEPSWNDQVSSFKVTSGCTITLWENAKAFGGGGHHFRSNTSYKYVGSAWNDKTSFVECSCR